MNFLALVTSVLFLPLVENKEHKDGCLVYEVYDQDLKTLKESLDSIIELKQSMDNFVNKRKRFQHIHWRISMMNAITDGIDTFFKAFGLSKLVEFNDHVKIYEKLNDLKFSEINE